MLQRFLQLENIRYVLNYHNYQESRWEEPPFTIHLWLSPPNAWDSNIMFKCSTNKNVVVILKLIVLEDYWKLSGEISHRSSGNHPLKRPKTALGSIQWRKSYSDSPRALFCSSPR